MNRLVKTIVLTTAVAATAISTMPAAQAKDRHHRRHHEDRLDAGELAAIGIFGLAAGVIASSIVTQPPRREYIEPMDGPDYYPEPPAPRYQPRYAAGALEPWTPEWYDYCEDRYRTFNPRTGTYTGYDGRPHFCNAG